MARVTKPAAAQEPPADDDPDETDGTTAADLVLVVTATAASRRRAGLQFGRAPVVLWLAELTPEIVEMLLGDPALVVEGPKEVAAP